MNHLRFRWTARFPGLLSKSILAFCMSVLVAACGSMPVQDGAPPAQTVETGDPLEGFNRAIYTFNDKFDRYLLKPVAKGYRFIVPDIARRGVSNFFSNLGDPANMLNNLLQGKFVDGASDLGRFVINSTIGIGGLFDVAGHIGLEKHDEDFGQTLAVWGVGEGPYLVLPVLGPSNIRDGVGLVPDWYMNPTEYMEEQSTANKLLVLKVINRRDQLLEATDILEQAAGDDPYTFVREAYRQRRRSLVFDGNPPAAAPDPSLFDDDPPPAKPN